jgi:hypothetical protein
MAALMEVRPRFMQRFHRCCLRCFLCGRRVLLYPRDVARPTPPPPPVVCVCARFCPGRPESYAPWLQGFSRFKTSSRRSRFR